MRIGACTFRSLLRKHSLFHRHHLPPTPHASSPPISSHRIYAIIAFKNFFKIISLFLAETAGSLLQAAERQQMTAPAVHPVTAQRSKWTNKSSGKSRVSPTKAVPDTNFVQPLRRPLEESKQVAQYQLTTNLKQRNVSQLQGVRPAAPTHPYTPPPLPPPPPHTQKKEKKKKEVKAVIRRWSLAPFSPSHSRSVGFVPSGACSGFRCQLLRQVGTHIKLSAISNATHWPFRLLHAFLGDFNYTRWHCKSITKS